MSLQCSALVTEHTSQVFVETVFVQAFHGKVPSDEMRVNLFLSTGRFMQHGERYAACHLAWLLRTRYRLRSLLVLCSFVAFILFNWNVLFKSDSPLVVVFGWCLCTVKVKCAESPSLSLKLAKSDSLGKLMLRLFGVWQPFQATGM